MDYFGRPNSPYMGNYQTQMAQPVQPQPMQMRTNKIFVTSLEDALNRYAEPNTVMVYRHQDEKFEYEIITDVQGKKSYKTLVLSDYSAPQTSKQVATTQISMEDFEGLKGRIKALEDEVLKKYKEERKNEKKGGIE